MSRQGSRFPQAKMCAKKNCKKEVTPKTRARHKSVNNNKRPRRALNSKNRFVAETRKPARIELVSEKKNIWSLKGKWYLCQAFFREVVLQQQFSTQHQHLRAGLRGQESDSFTGRHGYAGSKGPANSIFSHAWQEPGDISIFYQTTTHELL
jgi:hypothetical protein